MNLYFEATNEEVALPTTLTDVNGREWYVLNVESPSSGGRSGKVRAHKPGQTWTRFFYPAVFRCYIASQAHDEGWDE